MTHIAKMIQDKLNGVAHSKEDFDVMVKMLRDKTYDEAQLAAWLMAVRCLGLSQEETADLTMAMVTKPTGEDVLTSVIDKHSTGGVGDSAVAPGVVAVGGHDLPCSGADDGYNVPLDIVEVVEQHGTVGKAHALAGAVVDEAHDAVAGFLRQDLGAVEEKFRGGAVDRFAGADAVGVVFVAVSVAAIGDFPQLPAHPGVAGAVVGEHVADAVVGDGLAVVLGQQVRPAAVAVGVGFGLQNLAQGTGCIGVN